MLVNFSILIEDDLLLSKEEFLVLVKARAGFSCEKCFIHRSELKTIVYTDGRERNYLEAHHIDSDPKNNRLSNGKCLCKSCHDDIHREARIKRINNLNEAGQASRAARTRWKNFNLLPKEEKEKFLKETAAKIRDSRIKNGSYFGHGCKPNCNCKRHPRNRKEIKS